MRRRAIEVLAIVAAIVGADQVTKEAALNNLTPGPCSVDGACVDVFWTLRFNLHFNPGASFSTGEGLGPLIGVRAIVTSVALAIVASFFFPELMDPGGKDTAPVPDPENSESEPSGA